MNQIWLTVHGDESTVGFHALNNLPRSENQRQARPSLGDPSYGPIPNQVLKDNQFYRCSLLL